jgi:3-deoxy-D-manno-octulosonic-acid transferase
MRFLYTLLIDLCAPFAYAITLLRGFRDRGYWEHGSERLGFGARRTGEPCVWVHAVSLGEVNAAAALVKALHARHPDAALVVTTATPTGRARARALFEPFAHVRYLPYDTPGAVRRFLERTQPRLAVIMETEIWPNLLAACRARRIPAVLASARITARSAARYARLGGLFREALGGIALIAAQSEADADRFRALGAAPGTVRLVGNIKLDLEIDPALGVRGAALRERLLGARPTWVAGSTHEGEEEQVLEAHAAVRVEVPAALLVLAPRHPQRFERIAELLERRGTRFVRASALGGAGTPEARTRRPVGADCEVLLLDRLGELMDFYAAADAAFVGGSLVPVGGHNLLEPAALGVPVLTGPHTTNDAPIARGLLESGGAALVASPAALAAEVILLLRDPGRRQAMGARARGFIEQQRGSLERLLALLAPWL